MRMIRSRHVLFLACLSIFTLSSCTSMSHSGDSMSAEAGGSSLPADYSSRLPQHLATNEKTVFVNPNVHAWGAYDNNGDLVRAGLATAGSDWCPDLGRPCHTKAGSYRVVSLGSESCKSTIFPIPRGGAPMPYCMYFDRGQALHGVPEGEVVEGNISHGCVRLHVADAEWLRFNFVDVGTKVVVEPY